MSRSLDLATTTILPSRLLRATGCVATSPAAEPAPAARPAAPDLQARPAQDPQTRPAAQDLVEHRAAMLRFARRRVRDDALAEDAVQDAMVAALSHLDNFHGQSTLRTWLIGILNHKIQDVFRRETRYVPIDDTQDDEGDGRGASSQLAQRQHPSVDLTENDDPLQRAQSSQLHDALAVAIDRLPSTLADVFRMQAVEGRSTAEVCAELGISESNCWVRLHRARKRLVDEMAAHLQ